MADVLYLHHEGPTPSWSISTRSLIISTLDGFGGINGCRSLPSILRGRRPTVCRASKVLSIFTYRLFRWPTAYLSSKVLEDSIRRVIREQQKASPPSAASPSWCWRTQAQEPGLQGGGGAHEEDGPAPQPGQGDHHVPGDQGAQPQGVLPRCAPLPRRSCTT